MSNVVIYTSSTCPYCTMTKEYLDKKGVSYEEKNISTDMSAREELMNMGHMGVPVTLIDGNEIVGFDTDRIDSLL
jgi:glutaredoxin-like YruB-family protein